MKILGRIALLDVEIDRAALRRDVERAKRVGGEFWRAVSRWLKAHPGVLA